MSVTGGLFTNVLNYVTTFLSTKHICNIYVMPVWFFHEVNLLTDCSDLFLTVKRSLCLPYIFFL